MRNLTTLIFFLLSINLLAQKDPTTNYKIEQKRWDVGTEKLCKNNRIYRFEGENTYSSITNIEYERTDQVAERIKKQAEDEMWTEEKLKSTLDLIPTYYQGGIISLYVARLTIHSANAEMFILIIKDKDENEIFRKEFDSDIPNTPYTGSSLWYNYMMAGIDIELPEIFNVYIVDKLGGDVKRYKFQIKKGS